MLPEIKRLGVKKIMVFGSVATGDVGKVSDIDLIVVKETDKRFLDRLDEFYTALDPKVAVDLLVYTPKEFTELQENSSFLRRAVAEGKVLYEA